MFRPATSDDVDFFWHWRELAEAEDWYGGNRTDYDDHVAWYLDRLGKINLLVWYFDKRPAGCVRIDSNGEVAFAAHPLLTSKMLEELRPWAKANGGRLKVTLDAGDRDGAKALRDAGFREYPVKFFAWRA